MELEYAFCAKFADVGTDGFVTLFGGGIDSIAAAQFPTILLTLAVTGCVTVPLEEANGDHQMRIELFGPTGDRHPLEIEFPVMVRVSPADPPRAPRLNFAVCLQNLIFGMAGRHEFRISVDGRQLGTVPLYITRQADALGGQR
jgi:hypothetical protein